MRYKIGQKVLIRKDLDVTREYCMEGGVYHNCVSIAMKKFRGKVATIGEYVDGDRGYRLKEDERGWVWTDEMLELSNKMTIELMEKPKKKIETSPSLDDIFTFTRTERVSFPSFTDYLTRWTTLTNE